jgi:hypothetical protein
MEASQNEGKIVIREHSEAEKDNDKITVRNSVSGSIYIPPDILQNQGI